MTSAYNIATEKGHINLKLIICFFIFLKHLPTHTHTHTHTHSKNKNGETRCTYYISSNFTTIYRSYSRMDTSFKTGYCGCWRRCKSATPSKRMLKIYISTFLNLFSSAFALTMLFPYLPFMVEFLLPELEETLPFCLILSTTQN